MRKQTPLLANSEPTAKEKGPPQQKPPAGPSTGEQRLSREQLFPLGHAPLSSTSVGEASCLSELSRIYRLLRVGPGGHPQLSLLSCPLLPLASLPTYAFLLGRSS